jgi:FtsZ-binding cell division protein ZapB
MSKQVQLPDIPEAAQTPLVKELLGIIAQLAEKVRQHEETITQLQDEIAVLKGEKKRPQFKPSQLDKKTGQDEEASGEGKRPGSAKRSKTAVLEIHEERVIPPTEPVPAGSRFKGYHDYVVQDLVIQAHNTRYRLERWETPDGQTLTGQLPESVGGRHFGPTLVSYILYQHHHCQVTQPLLVEQLREWGIDISTGQIDALLTANHAVFQEEKDALLSVGLACSRHLTVDDTGARHQGKNGYTTHIGNEYFAWFASTESKSRLNFLHLLRAGHTDYRVEEDALVYMGRQKLPKGLVACLRNHPQRCFATEAQWDAHLTQVGITQKRHRRIATEGALLGSALHHGVPPDLAIVSDDAGQFNVLRHGLCWVHTERLIHKLIPLNETHRQAIAQVRGQVWTLYADLKAYKQQPTEAKKVELAARFDTIFTTRTPFETLNQLLKRLYRNKAELLLVLERPDIPLHTNGSEQALRDPVKKRKVSSGTRSDLGRRCRDTFMSLKRSCRKLGVSFWRYLTDRTSHTHAIPPLPDLIRQQAAVPLGAP